MRLTLFYGFAIFAMFFGSGNIIFPLQIGVLSGGDWLFGAFGLLITGVLLPFLGMFAVKMHRGSYESFFGEGGELAKKILPLVTLSLLGSIGVVPRCITVAHGAIKYAFPDVSLFVFSTVFCILMFLFCTKERWLLSVLGKWMSPILFLLLISVIFVGVMKEGDMVFPKMPSEAFNQGFVIGYHTMDLLAAFFFSTLIFNQIKESIPPLASSKEIIKIAIFPMLCGATILSLVYIGLVFLGAKYAYIVRYVAPEFLLVTVVNNLLPNYSKIVVGVIITLSCLTTAVALNSIYARYLCLISRSENNFYSILFLTTFVSFIFSQMNFSGISYFLNPVLEMIYPNLIVLTMLSILMHGKYYHFKKIVFYISILNTFLQHSKILSLT
ncbi:branched-chain amino acid transport system II carrier protein [Candidatus Fokinia crypta]|nr:branched-chain amino acid transport system II carrier protein [Candidatus Fokinia cryptica]